MPLPEWVEIRQASNSHYQQIIELQVDKGEASAIALAIEMPGCVVILDDYKTRRVAENLGINITGTNGVIIKAKQVGIIPSIKPYLEKIKETTYNILNWRSLMYNLYFFDNLELQIGLVNDIEDNENRFLNGLNLKYFQHDLHFVF